ncbi:hypothetical protein GGR57DRAFT_459226 [Xylariaceae sp. FL1272]|nr:hypothetical protein GGR57DRAFT_459226 [Xylariaceae sp. FL1272]
MERKRKLPARAAARNESASKRRNITPDSSVATPASAPKSASPPSDPPAREPSPPAPLPTAIQSGQPLPTVEKPQQDDLSSKDYQSVQESGVMAESLTRSRQKWLNEGIFEKYWTKPSKKKGVVKEDANNPAKDTMTKIGQVTITVEPHVLDATIYAVKDTKHPPATPSSVRPILQYGPPNDGMPPPPKPSTASTSVPVAPSAPVASPSHMQSPIQPPQPVSLPSADNGHLPGQQMPPGPTVPPSVQPPLQSMDLQRPPLPTQPTRATQPTQPTQPPKELASPRGLESVLAPPQPAHAPAASAPPRPAQLPLSQPQSTGPHPSASAARPPAPPPVPGVSTSPEGHGPTRLTPPSTKPPPPVVAHGQDPIIVTLAEKASENPGLRDLMKRVAVGEAAPQELAHFQNIIDQITLEYRNGGGTVGPAADRLLVDGKNVKYIVDEAMAILYIVLSGNEKQRGVDLRPPPGSDPLIVYLVKRCLEDKNLNEMVRRIHTGKTKYTDTTELKSILERMKTVLDREANIPPKPHMNAQATSQASLTRIKGDGEVEATPNGSATKKPAGPGPQSAQQALRSKGPPPAAKPDIAAVVFEFAGGTGDRYLFPKYSILEFSEDKSSVIVSFLIVRKGSRLEHGGDPSMDFYQPMTLRIFAQSAKILENLQRVVAPLDEVQKYMDDVMENMTRSEYILLAMRLPKSDKEDVTDDNADVSRIDQPVVQQQPQLPGVMWDARPIAAAKPALAKPVGLMPRTEDENYQSFINNVSQ